MAESRVLGDAEVRAAARRGVRRLRIDAATLITPQARSTAQELGVALVEGEVVAAAPAHDASTAIRRTLYRRGARWMPPDAGAPAAGRPLGRVAIGGTGAVGASTALLVAEHGLAEELVLIDVVPGLAAATALDLAHASGITRQVTRTRGSSDVSDVAGAAVVVITAGQARRPGMSRAELAAANVPIVRTAAAAVAAHAPDAVVVVVTNPVDEMTQVTLDETGFPRQRVLGMAGTLDSARFRHALAEAAGVDGASVEAFTLGSHGDEMVPIVSAATVQGRPATQVVAAYALAGVAAATVQGGAAVVELRRTGSAAFAPAHAIVEVLRALAGAPTGPVSVTVRMEGEYGITGTVLGVRAILGPGGVREIVTDPISADERDALHRAAAAIRARLEALPG